MLPIPYSPVCFFYKNSIGGTHSSKLCLMFVCVCVFCFYLRTDLFHRDDLNKILHMRRVLKCVIAYDGV